MIVDLERADSVPEFAAEVCIVGAGAAGIVLAVELMRQGKRVLLLESGGAVLEPGPQALNEYLYRGQPHRGANIGRFRALGGTTTVWGGQVLELREEDFLPRAWVPGSGWPFRKKELEPYYARALNAEGLGDVCRNDREIWRQMRLDPPDLGDSLDTYFTRWCPEPDFARLCRETLASPRLRVVLHATVTRMLLDQDGSRLCGIQCTMLSGREIVFSAAQYVLCLGSVETVRFLLQPLPGAQTPRWNQSGLLGRHFQSHIDFNAARVPEKTAAGLHRWFANVYLPGQKYHPKFHLSARLQQQEKILNVGGAITCINAAETELRRVKSLARNWVRQRDFGLHWDDVPRALRQLPAMLQLAYGYQVHHRAAWPKNSSFWLRVHCEQEPLSASRIILDEHRDATGLFRVQLDWHVSPLEWKTVRFFTEQVKQSFSEHGLEDIVPQPELAMEQGFRNITFDDSHHHMGGTRMSASPAEGVVDANLKLHGVENAYVCSGSVFPCSGFSNPTHTLIALAIRLADHLTAHKDTSSGPQPQKENPDA